MILSVNQIHKSYGREKVLKGISFTIDQPQIVALVGPNGSGKSTLLNIITNLVTADQGTVTILGKNNKNPQIFKEIAFMQDNGVLYDYLTGYDHLQFISNVQKIPKQQMLETAERIGMTDYLHKKVGNYSLGMKQHLLLTMALLNQPKLLILDEPLNGLDPTSAIKVRNLLRDLYEKGTTIMLSSHQLAEIDLVTSDILFLKDGNIIQEHIPHDEKIGYQLSVDNVQHAKKLLEANNIPVKIENNQLLLRMKDTDIHDMLQLFFEQEVKLLDIEKKMLGSEDRYQQIFGADVS